MLAWSWWRRSGLSSRRWNRISLVVRTEKRGVMTRPLSRGSRRIHAAHLWVAMVLLLAVVAAACGEDSTPASAPTQAPTATPSATPPLTASPTPAPTATPSRSMGVEFWELDVASTGQDLVAFLTDEEAACVENELGANYQAMLEATLFAESGGLMEGDGGESSPLTRCLAVERAASASISMFSVAVGGFSAGTRECIAGVLSENPAAIEALARQDESAGGEALLGVIACLTPEEAAVLTPPGEGPAPNPNDIACLIKELEGTSSGERIIAVLSGADTSGKGLTMEESAALGQAVEACGIETGFEFPDPAGTGATPGQTTSVEPRQCRDWNTDRFFRDARLDDVLACLAGGSDPNVYGDFGNTPLHYAATGYNDDPEMIRVLISHGADPNSPAVTGLTPLHTAAALNGNPEVVAALLEGGSDPQLVDGQGRVPGDLVDDNPRLTPSQKEMVRNALSQP